MGAHDDAIGLWQLRETVPVDDDGGREANDAYTFDYDGEHVTLRLMTLQHGLWKSADDFYRLAARWEGDMLSYRPPFGDWQPLACFVDGHFEDVGSGVRRIFDRIGEDGVAGWNAAILAPRAPHDYAVKPTDDPGADG